MTTTQLVTFIAKTKNQFSPNETPTQIYNKLRKNTTLKLAFNKLLSAEDVIIYCFMIPIIHKDKNITIDEIKENLFGFKTFYIQVNDPTIGCNSCGGDGSTDCHECDYGRVECETCEGTTRETCSNCDGSGAVGDEACEDCDGSGEVNCSNCNGSGKESCSNCDGDGSFICSDCDGDGEYRDDDQVYGTMEHYITYNQDLINELKEKKEYTKIDSDVVENLRNSDYVLLVSSIEEYYSDSELLGHEEETVIFTEYDNPDHSFVITSSGQIY